MKKYCKCAGGYLNKLYSWKIFKLMRNTLLLVFITVLQAYANDTYSQNTKLTLNLNNVTVANVLEEIQNNSEFYFLFNAKLVNVEREVSISMEDKKISEILTSLFSGTKVNYIVYDRQIILTPSDVTSLSAAMQQLKITGTVTDKNGPMPGVNVVVTGTTLGTITDIAGKYSINVPQGAKSLTFTFMGMVPQEISIGTLTQINVTMTESAIGLEEVVVVGYGSQKKVSLTGSVGMVNVKEFETRPITNVTQALQGKVPGLLINQVGGQPGGEQFRLSIRGVSTFSGNDPLVIVDGIAMSLTNLNPQDIESVSILKDAASAAIYGARASGGVILVTTKKGKVGRTRISYDGYVGVQTPTMLPEAVNAYEHVMLFREAQYNDNPETSVYKYTLEEMEAYKRKELPETDRIDYLFNSALQHNHNLSISGGSEINQYILSLGFISQDGTVRNTSSNRYNLRLNNNIKVNDRFNINLNLQFSPTRRHQMSEATYPSGPTRGLEDIIYNAAFRRGADDFLFTSDGRWASITGWANRFGLASKDGGFQEYNLNRFTGVVTLDYKLNPHFSINGMYGGKYDHARQIDYSKRMQFINPDDLVTVDFDYNTNSMLDYNDEDYQHNVQFLLNYDRIFNDVHEFKGLLGVSEEWNTHNWERLGRRNFVTDDIYVINAGSSDPSVWTTEGSASEWAIRSYFGRLNYSFKGKYLFESTLRYDGSSRFKADTRWGLFPSFSAGWRLSEESFMTNIEWIDNLKIRGSWGQVGNQNVPLYQYYSTIATSAYYFNGAANTATYYSGTANTLLEWETKTTTNFGVDLGLADNKLNLTLDLFKDNTKGILMRPAVPTSYGLNAPYQNVATVDNVGWETQISYRDKLNDFSYNISFQISDAKNKVVSMIGSPQISSNKITETGYEMNEWFGYKSIGIFTNQEEVDNYAHLNNKTGIGDLKIEDINNDGKITADDRQRLGSSRPRFPYGFTLELGWKNFDFSAFVQGVAYKKTYIDRPTIPFGGSLETAQKVHLDRWHLNEDRTAWIPGEFPKMRIGSFNNTFSSFWLSNAAYLRMKNIQLGYSLPPSFSNRIRIERMRFYISGENLFTLTGIYGFDPEAPDSRATFYPLSRVVNLGVNVTF